MDRDMIDAIQKRIKDIREWLADDAPYVMTDQRHLNEHTPERAYWHYGYQAALADILKLSQEDVSQRRSNEGKSS